MAIGEAYFGDMVGGAFFVTVFVSIIIVAARNLGGFGVTTESNETADAVSFVTIDMFLGLVFVMIIS